MSVKSPIIVAVSGLSSNTGKTTLVCDLLKYLPGWEAILAKIRNDVRGCTGIQNEGDIAVEPYPDVLPTMLAAITTSKSQSNLVSLLNGHYKEAGLLSSRLYDDPKELQIYSRLPASADERRFMFGGGEGQFIVPFSIPDQVLIDPQDPSSPVDLAILAYVGFEKSTYEQESEEPPTTLPYLIQNPDATPEQVRVITDHDRPDPPALRFEILDQNLNTLVEPGLINGGQPAVLSDPTGEKPVIVPIASEGVAQLFRAHGRLFLVQVSGASSQFEYFARKMPLAFVTGNNTGIRPLRDSRTGNEADYVPPSFRSRGGTFGMQLRGGEKNVPMALFEFRDVKVNADRDGRVPFEVKLGIERSTSENIDDQPTEVELSVVDRSPGSSGQPSEPIKVYPETNRTAFVSVPASYFHGGSFDILLRARTAKQYVGVTARSVTPPGSKG
jgi:hypothetical protein